MINLNDIAEDLFNKIRSRYSNVKMGDQNGKVTSEAELARFIDFEYKTNGETLGHVNVSLSEDDGLVVYYSSEFVSEESDQVQKDWYNFLRELRTFSKKRMLNFDTRDITKSNLDKRDYQFLATPSGDTPMSESKLYGSSRKSYQDLSGATMIVTHTKPVNAEQAGARSMHIENIFIENTDGERFKYPLKHLNGARALGRHVANGGTPYDAFGTHIIEMSQELGKLRKFKTYMGRSGVMAEAMGPVADRVNDRIAHIKKEVTMLQRESYYKDVIEGFESRELSEVPDDVKASWVEALTIKSFQEELQDVFPYVYDLVAEAEGLGPKDLLGEDEEDMYIVQKGDTVYSLSKQSGTSVGDIIEINGLGDNAEIKVGQELIVPGINQLGASPTTPGATRGIDPKDNYSDADFKRLINPSAFAPSEPTEEIEAALEKTMGQFSSITETNSIFSEDEQEAEQALKKLQELVSDHFAAGIDGMNAVESLQGLIDDPMLNEMLRKVGEKDSDMCVRPLVQKYIKAKSPEVLSKLDFGNMQEGTKHGNSSEYDDCWDGYERVPGTKRGEKGSCRKVESNDDNTTDVSVDNKGQLSMDDEEEQKTPLGEFILSYFDRETGKFPKGETAVLTMVEKEYGDKYVSKAAEFIQKVEEKMVEKLTAHENMSEGSCAHCGCEVGNPTPGCDCKEDCHAPVAEKSVELDRVKSLAGL
jgi:hypothetical protein